MGGSSSHRRRLAHNLHNPRPRPSASQSPPTPTTPVTPASAAARTAVTFDRPAITNGPGFDLLRKSGWTPGTTLGPAASAPSLTALSAPLPIAVRHGRHGVGASSSSSSGAIASSAPATPKGRGSTAGRPHNYNHHHGNKKYHGHSHPRFSRRNQNKSTSNPTTGHTSTMNIASSLPSTPNSSLVSITPVSSRGFSPVQPDRMQCEKALVRQLENLDFFDALRPRCQFCEHAVRDLKALRKHERACPANSERDSASSPLTPPHRRLSYSTEEEEDEDEDEEDNDEDALSTSSLDSDSSDEEEEEEEEENEGNNNFTMSYSNQQTMSTVDPMDCEA